MCAYCNMGDTFFRHDPPFDYRREVNIPNPNVPLPLSQGPINPWPTEKLQEYLALLKEVKALEDSIGCPCVPDKPDYIKILEDRLTALEARGS